MTDCPHEFLNPAGWKPAVGYANGIAAKGRVVYLGGLVGWNGQQEWETDDFVAQVDQTLANIVAVLEAAGARPEHLVRLTWFITDKRDYVDNMRAIGQAYRKHLGRHFPSWRWCRWWR